MKEIKFIEADPSHLEGIINVENKCFTAPWTTGMFLSEMYNENTILCVLLVDSVVVGYISLFRILDEMHVNNIGVDPDFQRQGYASMIMDKAFEIANELPIAYMTLEVRSSNTPAIELYKKYGFETVGLRKGYYKNPKEDAMIMTRIFA